MPNITYVLNDGTERVIDVPLGRTVMEGAVRNNLPGIVAECGGSCSCATCHVFLQQGDFEEAAPEENDLLEFLDDATECSRLSCQLVIAPETDGARIVVAGSNG
ncbi:2Fe-2S iron-sulfur cluster-binding protein [Arthrobacter rhombi]|uniref:2Fe-2S iron-sulfur cluster-binding protein n=1 Tax=Arthrobacter rhombi TaxID=71253 RepID=UPI0031E1D412